MTTTTGYRYGGATAAVVVDAASASAAYLGDATNVLVAVLLGESEILVQAEADVVAVESVGGQANVKQVLLKSRGDGRLARSRQSGKPNGEAALATELIALVPRERRVPCDIAR